MTFLKKKKKKVYIIYIIKSFLSLLLIYYNNSIKGEGPLPSNVKIIMETMGLEPISLTCKVNILPTKLYPHVLLFFFLFLKLPVIIYRRRIEELEEDKKGPFLCLFWTLGQQILSQSRSQIIKKRKRQDSNPRGQKPLIFQVLRYKPDSATFP